MRHEGTPLAPLIEILFLANFGGIVDVHDARRAMHDGRPRALVQLAVSRDIPQLHRDVFLRHRRGYELSRGGHRCNRSARGALTWPFFVRTCRSNSTMRTPLVGCVGAWLGFSEFCTASAMKLASADLPLSLGPTISTFTSVAINPNNGVPFKSSSWLNCEGSTCRNQHERL